MKLHGDPKPMFRPASITRANTEKGISEKPIAQIKTYLKIKAGQDITTIPEASTGEKNIKNNTLSPFQVQQPVSRRNAAIVFSHS